LVKASRVDVQMTLLVSIVQAPADRRSPVQRNGQAHEFHRGRRAVAKVGRRRQSQDPRRAAAIESRRIGGRRLRLDGEAGGLGKCKGRAQQGWGGAPEAKGHERIREGMAPPRRFRGLR